MKTASIYVRFDVVVPDTVSDDALPDLAIDIPGNIEVTKPIDGKMQRIEGAEVTNYDTEEVGNIEIE